MSVYSIAVFLITYLICSINPAIEICKRKTGTDIRDIGTGDAETENATKVLGRPLGFLVFILDIVKVILSYYIVYGVGKLFGQDTNIILMKSFMIGALLGQCYPIYYSFKGGRGTIVALITIFILNHQMCYICLIAGLVILILTRMLAMANIGGILLFVILIIVMKPEYTISALVMAFIILFKHRRNIQRMIHNQEDKSF